MGKKKEKVVDLKPQKITDEQRPNGTRYARNKKAQHAP